MSKDTKISIESGMKHAYALIALMLLALSSGCIGSQNGNIKDNPQTVDDREPMPERPTNQ